MSATKATRKPRAPALPFPELPDARATDNALFWRAAWLRDVAKHAALRAFNAQMSQRKRPLANVLWCALYQAEDDARTTARTTLKTLIGAGGLLYAWIAEAPATPALKAPKVAPVQPPQAAAAPAPLPMDQLLPGGRFGPALRYGPLRILGTANGARWHRVCGGVAAVCRKATYRARGVA
jgi:hypothetical protein